jgi:hypothetical protein
VIGAGGQPVQRRRTVLTHGQQHQDLLVRDRVGEAVEDRERVCVGPVQVVEDEHRRETVQQPQHAHEPLAHEQRQVGARPGIHR